MYEIICRRHPYISQKTNSKTWIGVFREAKLKNDLLGKYSLRFRGLFEVVLKMVAKLEKDRIGWEELWGFFEGWEELGPYRGEKGRGVVIAPEVPEKYSVIATSQASIIAFTPEESPEIVTTRQLISFNTKIAQLIQVILKSLTTLLYPTPSSDPYLSELLFLLHLARSEIMKSLPIDWFSIPETLK